MADTSRHFWIDSIISRYPLPMATPSSLRKIFNLVFMCSVVPAVGYAYVKLCNIDVMPGYPLEMILALVVIFFVFYAGVLSLMSDKMLEFFSRIRPVLDLDEKGYADFTNRSCTFIFSPSKYLLLVLLGITAFEQYTFLHSAVLSLDVFVMVLVLLMSVLKSLLHWVGMWALISFLETVRRFGAEIPIRLNPFDPDRMGGLRPVADLTTLGMLVLGVLTTIAVPFWYMFSRGLSVLFVTISVIVVPTYVYLSMNRVSAVLKHEKKKALVGLAAVLQPLNEQINQYLATQGTGRISRTELQRVSSDLRAIRTIYDSVESMHTFPINSGVIVRISSSMVIPTLSLTLTWLGKSLGLFP